MHRAASVSAAIIIGQILALSVEAVEVDSKVAQHPVIDQIFTAYEKAFNAGKPDQIVALWKSDGEFIDPMGDHIVGREAIEKLFEDYFSRNKDAKLSIKVLSIKEEENGNVIVAEVVPQITKSPTGSLGANKANVVIVRNNEKWLIEGIEEEPFVPASYEHLKELQWMVGSWTIQNSIADKADKENAIWLNTTCQWNANKSFLTRTFTARINQLAMHGTEIIAWDPHSKTIRSWRFDSTGGFAQSTWKSGDNQWIIDVKGTMSDGTMTSAINTITIDDNDTITFLSQDRMKGDEKQPDRGPIKIVRVKEDKK